MTPAARIALVTGGGRGIGRHLALGLAGAGLDVAVLGRASGALSLVVDEIRALGRRAVAVTADVRRYDEVVAAVGAAEAELGPVELLVNNAGVIEPVEVPVWEADPAQWWDVVETDLRGPFHLVRALVPGMVARGGGRVVDLSSGAGATDREIYSAYCAAKAGLFRIGGNLHLAGFDKGIRAFELSPGVVRTDMTASMAMHVAREDWTEPADVVALVVAAAGGRLDAWSGCYLRAGIDTPESLEGAARSCVGAGGTTSARRLVVAPYGDEDPLGA